MKWRGWGLRSADSLKGAWGMAEGPGLMFARASNLDSFNIYFFIFIFF